MVLSVAVAVAAVVRFREASGPLPTIPLDSAKAVERV